MSELAASGASTTWRDTIIADGQIVAVRSQTGSTVSWTYVAGDHLGSLTTLTKANNNVSERDSYDAWGKRRNPDASDDPGCTLASQLTRGFTQQEMLDQFCLVNMNARLYDPGLGLFLSADSMVSSPLSFKGYREPTAAFRLTVRCHRKSAEKSQKLVEFR